MDEMTRLELLKRPPTEEIIREEELRQLLEREEHPKMYIGFEISGFVHLGTGLISMSKVKDLQDAGFRCTILLADLHSWINDKLGGDLETIKSIAGGYFKEALAQSLMIVEGDPERVDFVTGSEIYDNDYWAMLLEVSKHLTINRVNRMLPIMGREERTAQQFAQLIYPPMQISDIFHLGVDLAHGGMDQRSAHVGAREVGPKMGREKPVALHHRLLTGLQASIGQKKADKMGISWKMSKSKPESCIFIHDSEEGIHRKVHGAFSPKGEVEFNPVIDMAEEIILRLRGSFLIERKPGFGGDVEIRDANQLRDLFGREQLHPLDLKNAVAEYLVDILKPARQFFLTAKGKDVLAELERIRITR